MDVGSVVSLFDVRACNVGLTMKIVVAMRPTTITKAVSRGLPPDPLLIFDRAYTRADENTASSVFECASMLV